MFSLIECPFVQRENKKDQFTTSVNHSLVQLPPKRIPFQSLGFLQERSPAMVHSTIALQLNK
jgi:hypothetical protein